LAGKEFVNMSYSSSQQKRTMNLVNKTAIITGAAGGIGAATARMFARHGADVCLIDFAKDRLDTLAAELHDIGQRVLTYVIDVSGEEQIKQAVTGTMNVFGQIDILVNNVGMCMTTPIIEISAEEWDRVFSVNLRSVFLFCREVLPHMQSRQYGKIINLGSVGGKTGGLVSGAHYAASKAGIMCLTKSLALQTAQFNLNVNTVSPGVIKTPMTDDFGKEATDAFAQKIPFKKLGKPEDVAQVILFLASDLAGYITGENIDVDGGMLMD
jgi:3-oxoacyl-[acyl-carrier protein] reductase